MLLLARLASVQSEAEADLKRAEFAGKISDSINRITSDVYSILATYSGEQQLENIPLNDDTFNEYASRLTGDYQELKELAAPEPELLRQVHESEAAAKRAANLLFKMKESSLKNGQSQIGRDERKPLWRQVRECIASVMKSDLARAGEKHRLIANRSPEVQAGHRQEQQTMMMVGGLLTLLLTAGVAVYLTRGITSRLRQMNDNTYRLASGLPLNPVITGTDEIARLDQVFHQLEEALKESTSKEQAIFSNARDMILSLDESGKFAVLNPACEVILGYRKADLLGTYAIDKVADDDKVKVLDYLDKIKQKKQEYQTVEVVMRRVDGTTIDTLWSGKWSSKDRSSFCIIHDISERRQAERMKQEVLAMVSHDLRTPLNTTLNALDVLERSQHAKNEKEIRYLSMAKRNLNRMIALINDLLDIEKAKAGMMTVNRGAMLLDECFKLSEDAVIGFAEESQVLLDYQKTDLVVDVDDQLFVRVLTNLVSNAVKFSKPGGMVVIWADRKDNFAHVVVEDHGPGIPPSQLQAVFERFHQVQDQLAKNKGGSGLGLAICKVITELHGGKVWVESELGVGSKFQLLIPLAKNALDAHQAAKQGENAALRNVL
jgi:PAS domain S-box-containing protein